MSGSLISDMFIKYYAEARPICFLKTKMKTFEKHQIELSQNEIKFISCNGSDDKIYKLAGAHIKQGLSERCPDSKILLYSMKLALEDGRSCYVYFESKA